MSTFTPTPEQQAALDAFRRGGSVRLIAAAGSGKTTTLRLLANDQNVRSMYVAFNKAIAQEAKASFPAHVDCRTVHSVAYREVGAQFRDRIQNSRRISNTEAAHILGITDAYRDGQATMQPSQQVTHVNLMIDAFTASASPTLTVDHLPPVTGLDSAQQAAFARHLLPYARAAWTDLTRRDGRLRFQHSVYLKLWALSDPDLRMPVIYYDEAQDASPVVAQVIKRQQERGARLVVVGDPAQAIYGFTGAVDSLNLFDCDHTVQLTKSFRFGPAAATEANKYLTLLDAPHRVHGHEPLNTVVAPLPAGQNPDAILCRSNVGALTAVITEQTAGRSVSVAGGVMELRKLTEAARDLKAGRTTTHPELSAFSTWADVQEYAESPEGADLGSFVKVIDQHQPEQVLAALDRTVKDGDPADVTVSTAHKAKGLEWDRVRIGGDFTKPREDKPLSREETMLAYVAVTRARTHLDVGSLNWAADMLAAGRHCPPGAGMNPLPAPTGDPGAPIPAPQPQPHPMSVTLDAATAQRVRAMCDRLGMSVDEWVTKAATASLERQEAWAPQH